MDKKRKKALQFDNGRHWQHVLINDRFSEKASKHHSTVSIHPYVCALVQRWKQQQALRCTTPHVKRSSYTSSVYESEKKNRATTGWTNEGHSLYNVHTSCNKVLLCFTTRDHACHFLSAVKLDMTRLLTLLIVFDMRAWCRLILEVSLLPSGPFWYSFWSSSRRLDTLNVKAIGNNTSGSVASSGKFLKACRSFSKGNLTWQYDSNSIQRFNICFKYAFEQKATEDKKTHQIIMTESQKSQSNLENNLNTL